MTKLHQPLGVSFDDALGRIADQHKPTITLAARPFLKWVGGKRSIIDQLLKRVPESYKAYHEPFLGGGALFFALQPDKAYLSDINFHLTIAFTTVRDHADELIAQLKIHEANHSQPYYLGSRVKLFQETEPVKIAALFIYLNKTCFNGLYRVNKAGKFNVPMGSYKNPAILDEPNLRNASQVLQGVEIKQHSFKQARPKKHDFYYIDPPYHTTYSQYNNSGFGDEEHKLLADYCHTIDGVGGYFMVSNSDTPLVRELYKGYNIEVVAASRSVSCKAYQRGKENELIIRNYNQRSVR
jgi:DNA adenine methylase